MKNKILYPFLVKTVFLFAIFIFSLSCLSSANLGVSPASLRFENVLRDGYSEKFIVISIDSEELVEVNLEPRGDVAEWLNFSENNFSVSRQIPKRIKISVNPPVDIPNGNYSGFLRISTSGFGEGVEGHAVGIIRSTLDLVLEVEIVDNEIIQCYATNINALTVEKGEDLVFNLDVVNNGNIRINPNVIVDIWDEDQISVLKTISFSQTQVLPTTEGRITFRTSSDDLDVGQYWADVSVLECLTKSFITFDILEEGALKAEGILLRILTRNNASVGETVPIEVSFKNVGQKEVSARFVGSVSKDGKLIQALESQPSLVSIDEIENFNFFFTPSQKGKYVISGRVFYSNKKTFESSTTLEAFSQKKSYTKFLIIFAYILFAALILFFYYKIRKERRRFLERLRKLK